MGKRELLLLVVFVVLGVGVYQVTAPAAPADSPGFSISRMVQFAKAHFQGTRARRAVTRTVTIEPAPGVDTLQIGEVRGTIVVEGTDRSDIEVRLESSLAGLDETDLNAQEKKLALAVRNEAPTAAVEITFEHSGRRPRYELHVSMPKSMKVQLEGGRATAEVQGVAGVHLDEFEGELRTENLSGPVTGVGHELRAEFGTGAVLALKLREGRIRADAPKDVKVECERTQIEILDAEGPLAFQEDYCRMTIRGTGGPVKVTGDGGTIELRQVTHPLTIEADRLTVDAELETPAPTTIAVEEDTVEVSLPREGGLMLQATLVDGDLRLPSGLAATVKDNTSSIATSWGGGGPLVKIDVARGTLRIRGKAPAPES